MSTLSENRVRPVKFEVLIDQHRIAQRVAEIGRQISAEYDDLNPVLVGVLKGCATFIGDLMRAISIPMELEFVTAASYRQGKLQSEDVKVGSEVSIDLKGRHVLLVEGIVDTGRTATMIMEKIEQMVPASIEIVTLLDKPTSHRSKLDIKYKGFTIGNEFVIGYGLDNTQQYRNLPYIGRVLDS
ncbi:MAG: hypoxanthine phosphoribosyltransferase [Candidatus Zixiibacteriota bacterium]|nr:MAG: hypoxanthine phosphoribosyltransferase [candidate division Zixibacteria bacterium]